MWREVGTGQVCTLDLGRERGTSLLSLDPGGGGLLAGLFLGEGEVLPCAPAVKVDEGLHAAPFHDFALQPDKVDRL